MRFLTILILFLLSACSQRNDLKHRKALCLTDHELFRAFCIQAEKDDQIFEGFRSSPIYHYSLENMAFGQGEEALVDIVKKFPELIGNVELFQSIDRIGGPKAFNYGPLGHLSASMVCDIQFAARVAKRVDKKKPVRILEIGGGFGGRCKLLSEWLNVESYTIVDLPEVNLLAQKCLRQMGLDNVTFLSLEDLSNLGSYDLIISRGTLSEMSKSIQSRLIEKIAPAPMGYLTFESVMKHYGIKNLDKIKLTSKLKTALHPCEIREEEAQVFVTWNHSRTQ